MTPTPPRRMEIDRISDVTVVHFLDARITSDDALHEVQQALYRLVETEKAGRLLLDFGKVQSFSTELLGTLVGLQKKIAGAKGSLKLCSLNTDMAHIFRITQLDKVLSIHKDQPAALRDF